MDLEAGGFGGLVDLAHQDLKIYLNQFFGGFSGRTSSNSTRQARGRDLEYVISLEITDIVEDFEYTINYSRDGKCNSCNGTGAKNSDF